MLSLNWFLSVLLGGYKADFVKVILQEAAEILDRRNRGNNKV